MTSWDHAVVIADLQASFDAYEMAFMKDDAGAMDVLFHDVARTIRCGVTDALYGADAMRAVRRTPGGAPAPVLTRVAISVYGPDGATADAEVPVNRFRRATSTAPGVDSFRRRLEGGFCTCFADARNMNWDGEMNDDVLNRSSASPPAEGTKTQVLDWPNGRSR
jgi:hypothetical protein